MLGKDAEQCVAVKAGGTAHMDVPGVWSQSSRCVWTQTWYGHDADAQILALLGCPGSLALPFCKEQPQITDGTRHLLQSLAKDKNSRLT